MHSSSDPPGCVDEDMAAWLIEALSGARPRSASAIVRAILQEAHHVDKVLLTSSRRGKRAVIGPRPAIAGEDRFNASPGCEHPGPAGLGSPTWGGRAGGLNSTSAEHYTAQARSGVRRVKEGLTGSFELSAYCTGSCAFPVTAIVAETWQKKRVHVEGLGGSSVNASALVHAGALFFASHCAPQASTTQSLSNVWTCHRVTCPVGAAAGPSVTTIPLDAS